MTAPSFWTQSVDVFRPTFAPDARNDEQPTFPEAPSHTIGGVSFQPQTGAEVLSNRDALTYRALLVGPVTADLADYDRVRAYGRMYDVEGPVLWFRTGVLDHFEAVLTAVEG